MYYYISTLIPNISYWEMNICLEKYKLSSKVAIFRLTYMYMYDITKDNFCSHENNTIFFGHMQEYQE